MTFDQFSFDQRLCAGIASCGFTVPTPIQTRAIPEVLAGNDVVGLAQTGTGKTAAFALPLLQRLLDANAPKRGPVQVLVLAPTRELALQIHESFVALGRQSGIRSAAVFGGVGINPQIKAARAASVIVACPGRLLDLLDRGAVRLDRVQALVLDEADRMLDMGFMPDIKRIIAKLPKKRQNLLFSATMPPQIRSLADTILNDPATVQVDNTAPAKGVSHTFYPVRPHLKTPLLENLLAETNHDSVLVFTRTKHKAKALAKKLANKGLPATSLQGNMTQNQRQRALSGFRTGDYTIMVATDIAARGIDCKRISHVINFDAPDTAETYTHRIGRTGRAGRTGCAFSLVTPEDRTMVRDIERVVKERIERVTLEGFDYECPAPAGAAGKSDRPQNRRPARSQKGRGGRSRAR